MTKWINLSPEKKRQAVLNVLNKTPNLTAAQIRDALGLKDGNNCLSTTMACMRRRSEIDRVENADCKGKEGWFIWYALQKRTSKQFFGKPPEGVVIVNGDRSPYYPEGKMCKPPYGSLPYERPFK